MARKQPRISTAMNDLLEVRYKPSKSIESLKALCRTVAESTTGNYEHYFCIINSSGTGKTKLALELLKSDGFRGIYLLGKDIDNGWTSNMLTFIGNCPVSSTTSNSDVESYCYRFIDLLTKLIDNTTEFPQNTDLFYAQFDGNLLSASFEARLAGPPSTSKVGKPSPSKEYADSLCTDEKVDATSSSLFNSSSASASASSSSSSSPKSSSSASSVPRSVRVIVFDEAEGLIDARLYAPLQRALMKFPVVGIFLSTNSSIDVLEKPRPVSGASIRAKRGVVHVPPFVCVNSTDLVPRPALLLGRPLWNSQYVFRLGRNMTDLVEYAALKLVGGKLSKDEANYRLQCLSLIGSRYSIQPNYRIGGEFVCKYMATLFQAEFVADNIMCRTGYPSEPILAEASAWLMNLSKEEVFSLKAVVQCVSEVFTGADTLVDSSKGDRGEIAMAIAIGCTLDRLRCAKLSTTYDANQLQSSLSMPVSVRDFLSALHSGFTESMVLPFEGYFVNATHFVRYPFSINQANCSIAVRRMAAFFNRECEANVDSVLPMCKLDEYGEMDCRSMRCIRFQVKNFSDRPSINACAKVLHALRPKHCAPKLDSAEDVSISILVLTKAPATKPFAPRLVSLQRRTRNSYSTGNNAIEQLQFVLELQGDRSRHWGQIADILPSLANIAGVFAPKFDRMSTIDSELSQTFTEDAREQHIDNVDEDDASVESVSDAGQDEGNDSEDVGAAARVSKKTRFE